MMKRDYTPVGIFWFLENSRMNSLFNHFRMKNKRVFTRHTEFCLQGKPQKKVPSLMARPLRGGKDRAIKGKKTFKQLFKD